jgi:hypothetical protein
LLAQDLAGVRNLRTHATSFWRIGEQDIVGLANEDGYAHRGTINFVDNQVRRRRGRFDFREF